MFPTKSEIVSLKPEAGLTKEEIDAPSLEYTYLLVRIFLASSYINKLAAIVSMTAEFTYPPVSGQFEERTFDLNTVWKSSEWCWVKFSSNLEEWYGCFRGTAVKVAVAQQLKLIGVLTSDCFYVINPVSRDVAFSDPQTMVQQLASNSSGSKFIVAEWTTLKYIEADLDFKDVPSDIDCDNIEFGQVLDNKLQLNFEEIPDYYIKNGLLDLDTWDLQIVK